MKAKPPLHEYVHANMNHDSISNVNKLIHFVPSRKITVSCGCVSHPISAITTHDKAEGVELGDEAGGIDKVLCLDFV